MSIYMFTSSATRGGICTLSGFKNTHTRASVRVNVIGKNVIDGSSVDTWDYDCIKQKLIDDFGWDGEIIASDSDYVLINC